MDNSSKQLESTKSQQIPPSPSHTFTLKKKERTPEEGSKAIYRMALIAAIGNTGARCSTTNVPKTDTNSLPLPFVSSPVKTEVPSPASLDRTVVNTSNNCSLIKPENKSKDNSIVQEDQRSPLWVFEDTEAKGDNSETNRDRRVCQLTPKNLSFFVVLLPYIYFQTFSCICVHFLVCDFCSLS